MPGPEDEDTQEHPVVTDDDEDASLDSEGMGDG